jgi:hypothetical protein
MEKLHDLEREFHENDRKLVIVGLDKHSKFSDHPHAGRTLNPPANGPTQ